MQNLRLNPRAVVASAVALTSLSLPVAALAEDMGDLSAGQVVVSQSNVKSDVPSVQAKILVHKPIDQTWKVVADPVKLASNETKVKKVKVVSKNPAGTQQNVAYTVSMAKLLPAFNYVVMQQLSAPTMVNFHRVSGSFKDIQGSWKLTPAGKNTIVTYTLKLDPGPLVPKGMLLTAVKSDLPNLMRNTRSAIEGN